MFKISRFCFSVGEAYSLGRINQIGGRGYLFCKMLWLLVLICVYGNIAIVGIGIAERRVVSVF